MAHIADSPPEPQLPCSLESELGLLGTLLYNNDMLADLPALTPEDFYAHENQRVFTVMCQMIRAGQLVDGITLRDRLRQDASLEAAGGIHHITMLMDKCAPFPSWAKGYASVILERSARRRLIAAADATRAAALNDEKGVEDAVEIAQRAFSGITRSDVRLVTMAQAAEGFTGSLDQPRSAAISTGIELLDKRWGGGLHRGELVILAGRPSMGKTTLANNIGRNIARDSGKVGLVSAEMSSEAIAMRALSAAAYQASDYGHERFAYTHLRNGAPGINRGLIERATHLLKDLNMVIDDRAGLTVQQIESSAQQMRREMDGLDVLIIDYLQILGRPQSKGSNDAAILGQMTTALKTLARNMKIAVVLLSQLSRAVESRDDKRPQLSDLRESGAIEQDADIVCGVYRESYYLERAEPGEGASDEKLHEWHAKLSRVKDQMEAITLKQRNGPVGNDTLRTSIQHDLVIR